MLLASAVATVADQSPPHSARRVAHIIDGQALVRLGTRVRASHELAPQSHLDARGESER